MSREDSPYVVGDHWLDKRRDGKSPDIWQIASYSPTSRSVVYRSTRAKSLDHAKAAIHSFVEAERARRPQRPDDARVIPLLFAYWDEHGKDAISAVQIASSIRQFIGFLMQDRAGINVTVADLNPVLFTRFRQWRMAPHAYSVPWKGKTIAHKSRGVNGESVQRNMDDIRAAIFHHVENGRLPYAPKIPAVPQALRSPPKDRVLSIDELGAIVGYSLYDIGLFRFVALMIATAARPQAAGKFDPAHQFDVARELIDLHPAGAPRTKKRNPVLPAVTHIVPILTKWSEDGAQPVTSHKTRWRTMRRALALPADVEAKTIRHTVATMLRTMRVPSDEIETLLGHRVLKKTSEVYAKYDPDYLAATRDALTIIWERIAAAAWSWSADHVRTKFGNGETIIIDRNSQEAQNCKA